MECLEFSSWYVFLRYWMHDSKEVVVELLYMNSLLLRISLIRIRDIYI